MRTSKRDLPLIFAKLIPPLSILVVLLVFVLYAVLVRVHSALIALLSIGIPIIMASVIALWKAHLLKRSLVTTFSSLRLGSRALLYLALLFIISYLVSLCILFQVEARPIAYFCLVAVMAGLVFIEILGTQPKHGNWQGIILAQIVLLSLNLIFGQTLKLPLYFGGGDLLYHMGFISSIIDSGHITSAMEGYQYFPLFHIFGASGVLLTGMRIIPSYFILNGLSFVISLPIVYLLVKQMTKDTRLPLLATLLYALSGEVIFNGMYMSTRGMAYVFCLLVLYLLIQENRWLKIVSVGLIVPLVLLHQTTLLHLSGILVGIMILEFILHRRSKHIGLNYIVLFTVAYVGYWLWLCYPFLSEWLITAGASEAVVNIPSAAGAIREPLIASVAKSGDYSIMLFFIMIGIVSLLYQDDQGVTTAHVFALFTFVTIPLFVPSISGILSPLFLTYRLALLLSPFVAFAMAAGVLALMPRWDINKQHLKSLALFGFILPLILLYSFAPVFLLGNQTDLNLSGLGTMGPRRYFTQAELVSLSFQAQHKGDVPIYTDSHSSYCLRGYFLTPAKGTADVLDPVSIGEGYMLFRKEEFELRGVLLFDPSGRRSIHYEPYVYRTGDTPDLEIIWQEENRIFNNSAVQIYLK